MDNKKTALVTGANKGSGLTISCLLAKKGCQIWIGVRSLARGQQTQQELKATGLNIHEQIEIADRDSVTKAATQLNPKLGKLDVIINNKKIR